MRGEVLFGAANRREGTVGVSKVMDAGNGKGRSGRKTGNDPSVPRFP